MNNLHLLKKAQNILKNWNPSLPELASPEFHISLIGLAKIETEKATEIALLFLEKLGKNRLKTPFWGVTVWKIAEQIEDKKIKHEFLERSFSKVHAAHQFIYEHQDPEENGLCTTSFLNKNNVQVPLFNTFLVASNFLMIKIGEIIQADVTDFVSWFELTVHTFNEKLWDKEYCIYNAFDIEKQEVIPLENADGITPLFGGIPDIGQALELLDLLQSEHFSGTMQKTAYVYPSLSLTAENFDANEPFQGAISIATNWLLWEGMKNYETPEFEEIAEKIKQDTLELVKKRGFYAHFNSLKKVGIIDGLDDRQPMTAAVVIDFLI